MRIENEYTKTGYFWLPKEGEKKIPGILTIRNGGDIELEIVGHFNDNIKSLNNNLKINRIIGHIEDDGLVTLDDCFYTNKNISFGGISKSKINVNKVFNGVAYGDKELITFNTFSFSVDCLDEWVGISGITLNLDAKKRNTTINYIPPKNISYNLINDMKLEICFAHTINRNMITEAKVSQNTYFKLTSEKLRPLNDFTEIAYKITNFLCFAIDTTVSLKNISATSSEILIDSHNKEKHPVLIKIFYPSLPFIEKAPNKNLHDMLFTFGIIKNNAQDVFKNWLKAYEIMAPALGLYFSTKNGVQKYLDGKFLALVQGLETYHRRTSNEQLMDSATFETLISTIKKNCPEEHIDWLDARVKFGNEINLGKRLKHIIEPFKEKIGNSKERTKLIRKIVDTRNYLTHYNKALENNIVDNYELLNLCEKMEVIFQLHFLKVIGFSNEEIDRVIERNYPLEQKINKVKK